jgi:hypothetical protein
MARRPAGGSLGVGEALPGPARLTSLSRNNKVSKDRKTAHDDYDDQSDNDGVKLWVSLFVHEKNGFDLDCSIIFHIFEVIDQSDFIA